MDVDMNDAPARISMIMQVSRVVPITLVQKLSHVSAPDHQAMASEPRTPHAAHSVAVAHPSSRTTKTRAMSSVQGMRLADSRSLKASEVFGSGGGIFSGLSNAHTAM